MTKKQERHIIASAGTVLFLLLVFLILWFVYLTAVAPEQEEGIELVYAEIEEEEEPAAHSAAYAEELTDAAPAAPAQPAEEVATSPDPGSAEEHLVSEEETLTMLQAQREREEREAAERARKQKEAEAIAKANAMGSLFGKNPNGTNTSGDGDTKNAGQMGNPVGHGTTVGGGSWSLAGRGIRGTLPQPSNNFKQEGKVVVEIRVNAAGTVVSATVKGGDVSDKQTQQLALEAARKASFTEGDHDQIGTITYIFKLN